MAVADFGGMNGFVATEEIHSDDLIMFIPLEMIITSEIAKTSKVWQALDQKTLEGIKNSRSHLMATLYMLE